MTDSNQHSTPPGPPNPPTRHMWGVGGAGPGLPPNGESSTPRELTVARPDALQEAAGASEGSSGRARELAERWKDDVIGYPRELYGHLSDQAVLARAFLGLEEQLEAQRHAAEQMSRSLARAHEGEQRYNQMQFEANAKVTELREQLEAAHVAVIRHMNEVRATQEHLWAIAQSYDPARAEESARVMYDIARSNTPQRDEHGRLLDPEWAEKMIERWQPDSSPAMRPSDG